MCVLVVLFHARFSVVSPIPFILAAIFFVGSSLLHTSNKNFILKYFRCRDGKRTETRIGMEGICITHSCIPLYTVYMQHIMAHSCGMQEWVIQIPSIPILVSVLFPSLHLKYFRIKFLLLVCVVFMRMRTEPHPHPVIS